MKRKPWWIRRWALTWSDDYKGFDIYKNRDGAITTMRGKLKGRTVEITRCPGFRSTQLAKLTIDKWITRVCGTVYPSRSRP